ncbi:MAG: hypothetical protein LBV11_11565 [Bacillus cereus]|jgi:hypothetical protein|nr:hypothetical protein [Bacillus cereus]
MDSFLEQQYIDLKSAAPISHRANILYNIAYIKNRYPHLINYHQTLYLDIKLYITYYVKDIGKNDYGYDVLNIEKFYIIRLLQPEQQLELYRFTQRSLKKANYKTEWIVKEMCLSEKMLLRKNLKNNSCSCINDFKKYSIDFFKLMRVMSIQNLFSLLISLFIFFVLLSVILLPSPFEATELFLIEYYSFSDYYVVNHFCNVINYSFDIIPDTTEIIPLNWVSLLLFVVAKVFFFVLIMDFIIKNILKRISIDYE